MPDDVKTGADAPNDEPEARTTETPDVGALEKRIKQLEEQLIETSREAKQRRLAKRESDDKARQAEEARLKESQEWQKLAEKHAKDLETLRPMADKASELEAAFLAHLNKRLEAVPDAWKTAIPDFGNPVKTMEWLDANGHLFATRPMPNIDAGAGNNPSPKGAPKLTSLERELAKSFSMSEDDYIKFRDRGNQVTQTPDK